SEKEMVESGVTQITTYDAVDRVVRVDHPDDTFSRTEYASWSTTLHDRNDNVVDSPWYQKRINRLIDAELTAAGKDPAREAQAAQQTAAHTRTPLSRHEDPLGRPILDVEHAGFDSSNQPILYHTVKVRDVSGGVRKID